MQRDRQRLAHCTQASADDASLSSMGAVALMIPALSSSRSVELSPAGADASIVVLSECGGASA